MLLRDYSALSRELHTLVKGDGHFPRAAARSVIGT
jgi:hypothetical protein